MTPPRSDLRGYILNPTRGWKEVAYSHFDDSHALVEGDMLVDKQHLLSAPPEEDHGLVAVSQARKWPQGVIPYAADEDFALKPELQTMIEFWESNTSLRFVPKTNQAAWMQFKNETMNYCGHASLSAPISGPLNVFVKQRCGVKTLSHETLHAVNMHHEWSRWDATQHLNFSASWPFGVPTESSRGGQILLGPFDFSSVSLGNYIYYGISRKDGNPWQIATILSQGDIAGIQSHYAAEFAKRSNGGGIVVTPTPAPVVVVTPTPPPVAVVARAKFICSVQVGTCKVPENLTPLLSQEFTMGAPTTAYGCAKLAEPIIAHCSSSASLKVVLTEQLIRDTQITSSRELGSLVLNQQSAPSTLTAADVNQ